jgi:hypothetical protein
MKSAAEVFFRSGVVVVAANSMSTAGVLLTSRPVILLDDSCPDRLLGDSVRLAMSAFRSGVPHPSWEQMEFDRRKGRVDPVCAAVGARSDAEFARGARYMFVQEDVNGIEITPMRNDGRGSVPTSHRQTRVLEPLSSADQIGRAIRETLPLTE